MATLSLFNSFKETAFEGINMGSDTFKVALSNTAPSAANTVFSDITEIAAGSGYTAGGATLAGVTSAQTAGAYKWSFNDVVFTAAGGPIGPFRYAVIYDTTATNALVGWLDIGSATTLSDGQTLTLDVNPTTGVITA